MIKSNISTSFVKGSSFFGSILQFSNQIDSDKIGNAIEEFTKDKGIVLDFETMNPIEIRNDEKHQNSVQRLRNANEKMGLICLQNLRFQPRNRAQLKHLKSILTQIKLFKKRRL
jgi:hypothetical protein